MASLARYGREVTTVFDLLGRTEPALTAALGWTMIRSPRLLDAVLTRLELPSTPSEAATVHLETADKAGRTDIELHTPTARVIIEAKQGWILPGLAQLDAYAPRFSEGAAAGLASRFVTLSDSTAAWAHQALPEDVAGVPVIHWSWDEVRELISGARASARGHERSWLDQMEAYMGSATSKRPITDSLAYCIVITDDLFGDVSFRDYVVNQRVYFHPLTGGGWPTVPPNFLAFRWKGAVRQVNRVLNHEIIARLSDRYPAVAADNSATSRPPEEPHVLYHLGPDIPLPNGAVPSGQPGVNLRAQRFWVLLDQLLTQPTLVEARDATKGLGAT